MNIYVCDHTYRRCAISTSWGNTLKSCETYGHSLKERDGTFDFSFWQSIERTSTLLFVHTNSHTPWVAAARDAFAQDANENRHIVLVRSLGGRTIIDKKERKTRPSLIHECEWHPDNFGDGIACTFWEALNNGTDWHSLEDYLRPFQLKHLENYIYSDSDRSTKRIKEVYSQLHARISCMARYKTEVARVTLPPVNLQNRGHACELVRIAVEIAKI